MALNLETIKLVFEAVYFLHPHLVATCFVLSCLSSYWITTSDMNMFSDALKIIIKTNLNVQFQAIECLILSITKKSGAEMNSLCPLPHLSRVQFQETNGKADSLKL